MSTWAPATCLYCSAVAFASRDGMPLCVEHFAEVDKQSRRLKYVAHPTVYAGVNFRSRLEARWAAFFDLLGWEWEYEPIDLEGWVPDFRVHVACNCCNKPECGGYVFVEVKPYDDAADFDGHPLHVVNTPYTGPFAVGVGINPTIETLWEGMSHFGNHFDNVGSEALSKNYPGNVTSLWREAGNRVQWLPRPGER